MKVLIVAVYVLPFTRFCSSVTAVNFVKEAILNDPMLKSSRIEVATVNGIVKLSGTVEDASFIYFNGFKVYNLSQIDLR